MKHVREQIPDVQRLRPRLLGATAAAVVERATAKDLGSAIRDAGAMAADLEEVAGARGRAQRQATGEVTIVLRTLPGGARARLPWRVRHPAAGSLAGPAGGDPRAGGGASAASTARTEGAGQPPGRHRGRPAPVRLARPAAHDYNPFGTGPENRDQIGNVVDSDPSTSWSTETYYYGTLRKAGGSGRGSTSTPPRGGRPRRSRSRRPRPASACRSMWPTTSDLAGLRQLGIARRTRLAGTGGTRRPV